MRKFFSVLLKFIGIIIVLLIIGFAIIYALYNEPLPKGKSGKEADALACKVLNAVNEPDYLEARYVEWNFRKTSYKLDKRAQLAICTWEDYKVNLNLIDTSQSNVFKNGLTIQGEERESAINRALKHFNNYSFWVLAPFKIFDEGTSRQVITLDNGNKALLVTYTSGGTTPGDSYLWILDNNYIPTSFKMWVSIIPIGGLEANWNNWRTTNSGAKIASNREILGLELPLSAIKIYSNPEDELVETITSDLKLNTQIKGIIITKQMRKDALQRHYSKNKFEADINFIRPVLSENDINRFAENIMLLMQTNDNVEQFTYNEILRFKMRDSLY